MLEKVKNISVFIGAWIVCIAGMEVALRLFGDEVLAMGNQYRFYQFDPKLGWSNRPDSDGYFARSEYRVKVDINSLGMRDREPVSQSSGSYRIAAMGDSFTWGIGAAYGNRFTEVLEETLPNWDVLNFGVAGYGTTQHFLQLDRVLAQKPDYVVLAFCLSNDVLETIRPFRSGYNKPFAHRTDDGKTEITGYPIINTRAIGAQLIAADSNIRLVSLYNLIRRKMEGPPPEIQAARFKTDIAVGTWDLYTPDAELTPERRQDKALAFDIVADLLFKMNQEVSDKIGPDRFLVALVPTNLEILPSEIPPGTVGDEAGNQLISRLEARGIQYVDPRSEFLPTDFWEWDGHWNAKGHRKFADSLAERIMSDIGILEKTSHQSSIIDNSMSR